MAKQASPEEIEVDVYAQKALGEIAKHSADPAAKPQSPSAKETRESLTVLPPPRRRTRRNPPPAPLPTERMTKVVRYQATPTEEDALLNLVSRLNEVTGEGGKQTVTLSNLLRALVELLGHYEGEVRDELGKLAFKRPMNERGSILRHERRIAEALHAALKKAKSYQFDPRQ